MRSQTWATAVLDSSGLEPAFGTDAAIEWGDAMVLAALADIAVGLSIVAGCC